MERMVYNDDVTIWRGIMKNINNVLKGYRTSLGISLDELARVTGIPKSTLSRYENNSDQKMDIVNVFEIVKALKIPVSVMGREIFDGLVTEEDFSAKLPVLGRVSAGLGTDAREEVLCHETVEAKYGTGEYFCLQVKGDSMSPRIDHEDIVLVKKQDYVENGELAIVIVDNEDGLIKKVEYGRECIKLISFNMQHYPERVFEKDDMNRVKIVGKVVESKRKW